ncbi:MAG TPA: AI-2E family transporter [Steroidobacteraceae bacterium]|nr:AI-2E family transporter [Steroidobacteraceae bacterium]
MILAIALGVACLAVLWPFASVITWSAILAYVSWPLYRVLRRPFGRFQGAAAFCMTLMLTCAVILPALWLFVLIAGELVSAYRSLEVLLAEKTLILPEVIRRIPWFGEQLQLQLDHFSAEPAGFGEQIATWAHSWTSQIKALASGVGRSVGHLFLVMFTLFFLYRDGDSILVQLSRVVRKAFGSRLESYVRTAGSMTRAVLFGFLTTAFVQGMVAGIGYAILGIRGSVLLGAVTGVLSFVPFLGTALVWGSLGGYMLLTGHVVKGVVLLLWGLLLVHPIDNVLRPLLISNATHVPFALVMFGAIGGIAAWGLIGVFAGPVVLSIGLAIWREWAAEGDLGPAPEHCSLVQKRGSQDE